MPQSNDPTPDLHDAQQWGEEPRMTINRIALTIGQVMAIRVAIENFGSSLREDGLGADEHGRAMTAIYLARISELQRLMYP